MKRRVGPRSAGRRTRTAVAALTLAAATILAQVQVAPTAEAVPCRDCGGDGGDGAPSTPGNVWDWYILGQSVHITGVAGSDPVPLPNAAVLVQVTIQSVTGNESLAVETSADQPCWVAGQAYTSNCFEAFLKPGRPGWYSAQVDATTGK